MWAIGLHWQTIYIMSYTYKYPHAAVTADAIVFAKDGEGKLNVLLVERGNEPYKGCWAFPGGFMNIDETTLQTAHRELKEETGLEVGRMAQAGVYDTVDRDPRERVITVAYVTLIDHTAAVAGGDDATKAQWFAVDNLPRLAFDHADIFKNACKVLKEEFGPSLPNEEEV